MPGDGESRASRNKPPSEPPSRLPEGGWGWVVVVGSFMVNFMVGGLTNSFSVLDTAISKDIPDSSWVGSVFLGMSFASGLFAGAWVDIWGCRNVAISGNVIAAVFFAISYWATNLPGLLITVGILAGTGLAFTYLTALVILSNWFEKRISFVTALATCGSGVGSVALAPLFKWIDGQLGWRLTFVVVGAMVLVSSAFAFVFSVPSQGPSAENDDGGQAPDQGNAEAGGNMSAEGDGGQEADAAPSDDVENTGDGENQGDDAAPDAKSTSTPDVPQVEEGISTTGNDEKESPKEGQKPKFSEIFKQYLMGMFDKALLTNGVFIYFSVAHFLCSFGENVPFILIDKVTEHNLGHSDGSVVGSVGIASTVSRVFLGYLCDRGFIDRMFLFSATAVAAGLSIGIMAHADNLIALYACAIVFGICNGVYSFLTPVIIGDLFGQKKLNTAFGLILFFQGIGTIIGPPIVEVLKGQSGGGSGTESTATQTTTDDMGMGGGEPEISSTTEGQGDDGNYVLGCWFAGGLTIISGIMFFFLRFRPMKRNAAKAKSATSNTASNAPRPEEET